MTREEWYKEKSALDSKMLKLRKQLNEEHYYPRMNELREACEKIGHSKPKIETYVIGYGEVCGYCGKLLKRVIDE